MSKGFVRDTKNCEKLVGICAVLGQTHSSVLGMVFVERQGGCRRKYGLEAMIMSSW